MNLIKDGSIMMLNSLDSSGKKIYYPKRDSNNEILNLLIFMHDKCFLINFYYSILLQIKNIINNNLKTN